jgi:hypothetical protein
MRPAAALLLGGALLSGCGARRAPPDPAFPGPLAVDLPALSWTDAGLSATLRVRNTSPFSLTVTSVDWSIGPAERTGQPVDSTLQPGGVVAIPLYDPASPADGTAPLQVAGTVHTRAAGGIRRAEVFRAAAPASPPEIP